MTTLTKTTITDEQFARIRCSLDGRTHYFEATGSMYAQPLDQDEPAHLFDFTGVDISRCIKDEKTSRWTLLSRKFSLYRDPRTGELLRSWKNPWTGETVNVIHRAYDYQEFPIPPALPAHLSTEVGFVSLDINLKLPNRLAGDPRFAEYAPEPWLRSCDAYKFIFPTKMLEASAASPSHDHAVTLSYYRMGPWEPWMKMKGKPGFLVLNYTGIKTDRLEALHPWLRSQIEERLPLYREAPARRLQRSMGMSWNRFDEEFEAYLRGDEFPLPAPLREEPGIE